MAGEYFKKQGKEYDAIFYCDACNVPECNEKEIEKFADKVMKSNQGIIQRKHPSFAQQDLNAIVKMKKDTKENADKTKKFMEAAKTPLDYKPYTENNMFVYCPKNEKLIACMQEFWDTYSKEELTHRDQPLWFHFCYQNKIKAELAEGPYTFNKIFTGRGCSRGFKGHRYV